MIGMKHLFQNLLLLTLTVCLLAGCSGNAGTDATAASPAAASSTSETASAAPAAASQGETSQPEASAAAPLTWKEMQPTGSMPLRYAECFTVDYYDGGLALICMGDDRFLMVPEGAAAPEGLDADIQLVPGPAHRIYAASSAVMDLFYQCGGLEAVKMTGTDVKGWDIPYIRELVESDEIHYAGKYSAPDFEYLLSSGCDLVIENTMIYHTPEVKEKLEKLGMPVIVERSSGENHPLGRMEWIKLYGLLSGHYEDAVSYYDTKVDELLSELTGEQTGKTVAFFYINTSGMAVIRKSTDYIPKMIQMAGGRYIFSDEKGEENALSTTNMQMEAFYNSAVDADIIIYNSTIDGEIHTTEELLNKSSLLADFKAVKEGNVWCTGQNMFQQTSCFSDMIRDMHRVISGQADGLDTLTYLHRVK